MCSFLLKLTQYWKDTHFLQVLWWKREAVFLSAWDPERLRVKPFKSLVTPFHILWLERYGWWLSWKSPFCPDTELDGAVGTSSKRGKTNKTLWKHWSLPKSGRGLEDALQLLEWVPPHLLLYSILLCGVGGGFVGDLTVWSHKNFNFLHSVSIPEFNKCRHMWMRITTHFNLWSSAQCLHTVSLAV